MKRKVAACLLCFVLVMTLGMSTALAECTPSARELATLEYMVDAANCQIELMVLTAQLTPWDDVDWLLSSTDTLVRQVKRYARSIGCDVACEYTYYYIDGRMVAVDPLRVINYTH